MDSILCDYYQNDDLNEYYYYNIMNKLLIASLVPTHHINNMKIYKF